MEGGSFPDERERADARRLRAAVQFWGNQEEIMSKFANSPSRLRDAAVLSLATMCLAAGGSTSAFAGKSTFADIYSFTGGNDGGGPWTGLTSDKAGNLYGATSGGGTSGQGTIFKLAPDGTETVLYSFTGGN